MALRQASFRRKKHGLKSVLTIDSKRHALILIRTQLFRFRRNKAINRTVSFLVLGWLALSLPGCGKSDADQPQERTKPRNPSAKRHDHLRVGEDLLNRRNVANTRLIRRGTSIRHAPRGLNVPEGNLRGEIL